MMRSLDVAMAALLLFASPALAGPCEASIDELQARVDAEIEKQAAAGPSKPESLNATRNYQPTPQSIADAEGAPGKRFKDVLELLKLARAADREGNRDRCNAELEGYTRRALIDNGTTGGHRWPAIFEEHNSSMARPTPCGPRLCAAMTAT